MATEAVGYKGHRIEEEIGEALKKVGKDKFPDIQGLPYEIYLRLLAVFVPLLKILFKHWLEQGNITFHQRRGKASTQEKTWKGWD